MTYKKEVLSSLKSWEEELETNKHGMQQYAERAIVLLKENLTDLKKKDNEIKLKF